MDIEILYRPSYSLGKIALEGGEEVRIEGGSMVGMSDGINLETGATGGLWRSLSRSMFGGERLVVDLIGPGRVLMQSRSTDQFLAWLIPQLPFERTGQGD